MDTPNEQLIARLKSTGRCRTDIQQISREWSGVAAPRYDALAVILFEQGEGKALGILLNIAATNQIKMGPQVLAAALKRVDNIGDFHFPYRYQDENAIGPLLEVALAEDISWEHQALAAHLAAELAVKFDQPRQPVKKVLWKISKEIFSGHARMMVESTLAFIDDEDGFRTRNLWLIEKDVIKQLPKERPPVVIGGHYTVRRPVPKLGRNEPCHCGSGKKYKKCCFSKDQELLRDASSYEGVTRSQIHSVPSLVDDTAPIEEMRLYELKKLAPPTLNDDQLLAAYMRAGFSGLLELGYEMLLELKSRPGSDSLAVEHMKDLFDSALRARDKDLAEKLAQHIPTDELYDTEASRLQHELLQNPEKFADLEALCKKALTGNDDRREHLLLELSYAFDTISPAMSIIFGRAAIVSEPQRTFDNEVLFDTIEKNRITLDLEPWGDPIEEYLEWANEEGADQSRAIKDKDEKIETLKEQLTEAKDKTALTLNDLRKKELEFSSLEKKLQKVGSTVLENKETALAAKPADRSAPLPPMPATENQQQLSALRKKIESLKDEVRSQQQARLQLRKQLQDVNQRIPTEDGRGNVPVGSPSLEEDSIPAGSIPRKIRIPEFSDAFRKSCGSLPQPVAAKALQAAAGFAARDELVFRQAAPIEQLPGYFRIRVGIHYRLLIHQAPGENLQIVDIIPRQKLETWIRQHGA